MPDPSPFHPRTRELCTSLLYKEWAGCYAVCRYDTYLDREYFALRNAATVMDATPLYKYEVKGPGAAALLSRVSVRSFAKFGVGRVGYTCWCDEEGKILDDGTVTRLDDEHFRVTSADPSFAWLDRHARGLDVTIEDVSRTICALALQGPRARDVLVEIAGDEVSDLKFFRARHVRFGAHDGVVTRTGYTGDLGYELWVDNAAALDLWDAVLEAGAPHGLLPMGLDALDVSRVEAGFVLNGIDYIPARHAYIERQKSTPLELGFAWMVKLDREPFVGQAALRAENQRGAARYLVGLDVDWDEFEALHEAFGLPPHLGTMACRDGVPVYHHGVQVGQATTRAWSPLLKKYLALATVGVQHSTEGTELEIEVTLEYERQRATARVRKLPFLDLERKRS